MGYGLLRALPGETRLVCHRLRNAHRAIRETPATGASGPHDFTVRYLRALVSCASSVHRISTHVRDDRDPPLVSGETDAPYITFSFR